MFVDQQDFVFSYLDDTFFFSNSLQNPIEHYSLVFSKLKLAGIILNKKKCNLFKTELKKLGNIISKGRVKPDPCKTEVIKNYKKPLNIKELRSFPGFAGYSRCFIKYYASLCKPLTDIL